MRNMNQEWLSHWILIEQLDSSEHRRTGRYWIRSQVRLLLTTNGFSLILGKTTLGEEPKSFNVSPKFHILQGNRGSYF